MNSTRYIMEAENGTKDSLGFAMETDGAAAAGQKIGLWRNGERQQIIYRGGVMDSQNRLAVPVI